MKNALKKVWWVLTTYPDLKITIPELEKMISFIESHIIKLIYVSIIGLTNFVQRIILTTPTSYLVSPEFKAQYGLMTKYALALLVFGCGLYGLFRVMGIRFDLDETVKKIIGLPFFIILAPFVVVKMIDIFNRSSRLIINTEAMVIPKQADFGTILGIIIFMVIFAILMIRLIYYYAKRFIKILLFTILAPVVYVLWCFPNYGHVLPKWKDDMLSLMVSPVIHSLIMLILGSVIMGVSMARNSVMTLFCQMGALGVMNEVESMLAGYLNISDRLTPGSPRGGVKQFKNTRNKIKRGIKKGKKIAEDPKNKALLRRVIDGFKKRP